ncbi:hypothetical protein [Maledivibacter halophilus]|nr:hypothetical protein [Maledivibacter halophilus]
MNDKHPTKFEDGTIIEESTMADGIRYFPNSKEMVKYGHFRNQNSKRNFI